VWSEEEVEVAAEEEDAAANVAAEASPMPMKLRALLKNLFEKILIPMFAVSSIFYYFFKFYYYC
jgi:hypothetical protein